MHASDERMNVWDESESRRVPMGMLEIYAE